MWILLVIIMAQSYQVDRLEILGSFQGEKKCNSERNRALTVGLPKNMNIGCLKLEGVSLAYDKRANRAF